MSIAHIYKENDTVIIVGTAKELEALGYLLIAKAKLKDNLSAKLVSNYHMPNIEIETYAEQ